MVNVDRKQWRRFIQLNENNQYVSQPQGKERVIIDNQLVSMNFQNP